MNLLDLASFSFDKEKQIQSVVLYTYHDGKDVFTPGLQEQEALCKKYISSKGWNLVKEYSDFCDSSINSEDRPALKRLMNDTKSGDTVVVNHLQTFGNTMFSCLVVSDLLKKKIGVFVVEAKCLLEDTTGGVMTLNSCFAAYKYMNLCACKVYLVFSNKTGEEIDYKGSFTSLNELKLLLSGECTNDNRVQIRPLRCMKEGWNYHSSSIIGNEIDDCIETFLNHIEP